MRSFLHHQVLCRTRLAQPECRLYYPPSQPDFQAVKQQLEQNWLPALQQLLDIPAEHLPILWDCDFLFGPKEPDGEGTRMCCAEINVSSVAPYPESAVSYISNATAARVQAARQRRNFDP